MSQRTHLLSNGGETFLHLGEPQQLQQKAFACISRELPLALLEPTVLFPEPTRLSTFCTMLAPKEPFPSSHSVQPKPIT